MASDRDPEQVVIDAAIYEARRFVALAEAHLKTDRDVPSKTRAAMRRASLDLTRALAALRAKGAYL